MRLISPDTELNYKDINSLKKKIIIYYVFLKLTK